MNNYYFNIFSRRKQIIKSQKDVIAEYQLLIAFFYSLNYFELFYQRSDAIIKKKYKGKLENFKSISKQIIDLREAMNMLLKNLPENAKAKPLYGVNDNEKVIIFMILSIINNFLYEDAMNEASKRNTINTNSKNKSNEDRFDFVFDYPVDIIFMASISDLTPIIYYFMDRYHIDEFGMKENFTQIDDDVINIIIESYPTDEIKSHFDSVMEQFLNQVLATMKYQELMELAYSSNPDEDNILLTQYFLKRFIDDESFRSIGICDMIEFANQIYDDYKSLQSELTINSNYSKFFENAFIKLSDYFSQITKLDYSPFISSSIFETVNKLKKAMPKGNIRNDFKKSMLTILKNANDIKMASDQQNESLPYYFLDLSGTPLHKLMELNPKTIIPFTLSPYLLKKELPNIEVLRQTDEKNKKCQPFFDSKIFSCSPTANSTIAVIRDIFVEYDSISERLVNRESISSDSNIFKEKQASPLPGMLIFKLSMLQWDFMPNFALDMKFLPVFQVPYNSINKLALNSFPDGNPKTFYLDLHTADCNLCFYPLTEEESNAIRQFFKSQIRIKEYEVDNLKHHFLEKTKGEMTQAANNFIPNMMNSFSEKIHDDDNQKNNSIESTYLHLFKEFASSNRKDTDQLRKAVETLCNDEDAQILLLESVCYFCEKEPQYALDVIGYLEAELKNANSTKQKRVLTIIDRFIDPAILQSSPELVEKAKKLTESLHYLSGKEKDLINPDDLVKKAVGIGKGSHFFSLTSEERNERLDYDIVHREWLMKSIPDDDEEESDGF